MLPTLPMAAVRVAAMDCSAAASFSASRATASGFGGVRPARTARKAARVFGSFARGEAKPNSDLDLLVDMAADRSLLDTVGLIQDLQESLGRRVDVVTERALHRLLRARILSEARPL